jgi:hypothetical protein
MSITPTTPVPPAAAATPAPTPSPAPTAAATAAPAPTAAQATPEKKGPRIRCNNPILHHFHFDATRHEWFQSANFVEIGIFVKNVQKEQVELNINEQSVRLTVHSTANSLQLSVHIKLSSDETYTLDLDLCDTVVPEKTEVEYKVPKIEIKLHKKNIAKWAALERTTTAAVPVQAWADASSANCRVFALIVDVMMFRGRQAPVPLFV